MATIKDVSREAGVSIATVSRVINNTKPVNKETREKVEAAVERLNFQMNAVARSLRSNRSYRIAVIITSLSRSFFAEVIEGIETVATKNGYYIIISVTNDDVVREREQVEYFANQWVDGIILVSSITDVNKDQDYIKHLESFKKKDVDIPVITLEFALSNTIDAITVNHERVGYDATSYLLNEVGCRNILHISHTKGNRIGTMRMEGYIRALRTYGLMPDENYILYGDFTIKGGYKRMKEFLERGLPVDGVYCANDQTAEGVLKACEERELKIPDDIAVVGTDNIYSASVVSPSLTTINLPKFEMGVQAMSLMLHRIEGGLGAAGTNVILDHYLVERQSTVKGIGTGFII